MDLARGSTWAKWDLHVHSPASFNWSGAKLAGPAGAQVLAEWIRTINSSDVAAFAVMDYWTFDGIIALREHTRAHPGALTKTVFPGIELRVQSPTSYRLNIHAILSDELTDQQLRDFLSKLQVPINGAGERNLSAEALRAYARSLRADQLNKHGATREQLQDHERAWKLGSEVAEVTLESFRAAMKSLPAGSAVVFQPWNTYHGLSELKWQEHYTSAHQLFSQPDIFECKTESDRDAFIGRQTAANAAWFNGFWEALGCRPRLAVRGSDAHSFANYGKFQSRLPTWLKAAPTFRGLLQAIKEPAQRSWLGASPPKVDRALSKPSIFIDSLSLTRTAGQGTSNEDWFAGEHIQLNPDLVAVIGNKGSGKSALADIVALLGDTSNVDSFSFLNSTRFRDKKNNRSLQFEATLRWMNGQESTRCLGDNPPTTAVERVRYVPQSYFERVCSGQSEADLREFTAQIEKVIFAHIPAEIKGEAPDLPDLLRRDEVETNRQVQTMRAELESQNAAICDLRRRTSVTARGELAASLEFRKRQLADLESAEPPNHKQGGIESEPLDPKARELQGLLEQQSKVDEELVVANSHLAVEQAKYHAASRLLSGLQTLSKYLTSEVRRLQTDAEAAGLEIGSLVTVRIDEGAVLSTCSELAFAVEAARSIVADDSPASLSGRATALQAKIASTRAELSSAEVALQAAKDRWNSWRQECLQLQGPAEQPTSIAHIEAQIARVDAGPKLLLALETQRNLLARSIAEAMLKTCSSRGAIVAAAKGSIDRLLPIHPGFSLDFVNEMFVVDLEDRFFQLVKQVTGTFRGEDEGRRAFRGVVDACDLSTASDIVGLATGLESALVIESRGAADRIQHDIDLLVRKGRTAEEVLNLLYGFDWLRPRFTLAQAGQPLTQLSPGQRGAMLLVFFLLVEDCDLPIVLDQPEENLDNETVYSLLVPAIKQAKQRRQIIMVTHNANLAVCCDAEQVIHASFDRSARNKMTYRAGPIEEADINGAVVNVLEGTRPAFEDRRAKYGTPV